MRKTAQDKKTGQNRKSLLCRLTLFFLCICLCLPLSACKKQEPPTAKTKLISDTAFGTDSYIYDYTGSPQADFDALTKRLSEEIEEYHRLFDIYNEYEGTINLATLNRLRGEGAVKVDGRIIDLLLYAKEVYTLTGGKCNVAMGAVTRLWHDCREFAKKNPKKENEWTTPNTDALREASLHTDINDLIIDKENGTVELADPKMLLDVGAIAKGYVEELVAKELISEGKSGYVLDFGRNLRAVGTKKDGTGWKTGVLNPDFYSPTRYIYYHELKSEAIATSGDYENAYVVDGVKYHHIIDPKTLMPSAYYHSVSIICNSTALSDALSTAVFNMTLEEAREFVKTLDGVRIVLVPFGTSEVVVLTE